MQAGFHSVTVSGLPHGFGLWGGPKRCGGDRAKGIPRNLLTAAVADGKMVCVPTSIPEARVIVGAFVMLFALAVAVELIAKMAIVSRNTEAMAKKPTTAD